MFGGKVFPSPQKSSLDFIDDKHDSVFIAYGSEVLHECRGTWDVSSFTLDWLDNDGGYFVRVDLLS